MTVHDNPVAASPTDPNSARDRVAEEEIAQHVRTHHAAMVAELDRLTAALRDAALGAREEAHRKVAEWFETVLVPHADEEEATTYRAAGELVEGRLLIAAMMREHTLIKRLVALFGASEPAASAAAAYGRAVFEAFDSHQGKENDLILPLLVNAPQVSLLDVLGGAHGHQVGGDTHTHANR